MLRTIAVVVMSLAGLCPAAPSAAPPAATAPAELLPVPKSVEQGKFERPLREKYKSALASRDPAQRLALAHTLHEQAAAASESAARFVLLRLARDLAATGGDLPYSLKIIDDMAAGFAVNGDEMKASALSMAVDTCRAPPAELARSYLKVADEALAQWKVDLAAKAAYLATKVARGDPELLAQAKDREHAARLHKTQLIKVIDAQRKLARNGDDAPANLLVGQFLCFELNQWDNGLPALVKSLPSKLKDLAVKDLAGPTDAPAMAALADEWWDFLQPDNGHVGRRRAAYWYAKALPGLSGEKKQLAEKRIAETTP